LGFDFWKLNYVMSVFELQFIWHQWTDTGREKQPQTFMTPQKPSLKLISEHNPFKGTVQRDFQPSVFSLKHPSWGLLEYKFKFAKIFEFFKMHAVSMTNFKQLRKVKIIYKTAMVCKKLKMHEVSMTPHARCMLCHWHRMHDAGAQGGYCLTKKTEGRKSRDTAPSNSIFNTSENYSFYNLDNVCFFCCIFVWKCWTFST
jgi:hypothetical protein